MGVPGSANFLLAGAQGYQIERSLRFNSADSAYLNRTPASAGNRKTWTWSGWVKKTSVDSSSGRGLFTAGIGTTSDSTFFEIRFGTGSYPDSIAVNGYATNWRITTQIFRDTSAWYHIVVSLDTTQATGADRVKIYVNGVQITAFVTSSDPSLNADLGVNYSASTHNIGRGFYDYLNGYLTEINFIDGQALTPSSFGETNPVTGVWQPKRYTGTYGTNGFYLKFADNSGTTSTTLGKDSSGNSNNWTPNNFSVTAGAGNDSMIDTPTPYADGGNGRGNYAVLNPLAFTGSAALLQDGNLAWREATGLSSWKSRWSTIASSSGLWYCEVLCTYTGTSALSSNAGVGLHDGGSSTYSGQTSTTYGYLSDGQKWNNATGSAYGAAWGNNDLIQIAYNCDTGKVWFGKNGTWQNSGDPAAGTNAAFTGLPSGLFFSVSGNWTSPDGTLWMYPNFGQRPFAYTPPSGFLALNTQNLPEPTIKKPSSYMDVVTYTGTGSALTPTTGLGFSPDLVWIKSRSAATDHALYDAVRGAEKRLESNNTDAEVTSDSGVTAFNSAGFTLGTLAQVNTNAATYAAWCWDESATPGFDIVTYTGDGASVDRGIGHSLGLAPNLVIVKSRGSATFGSWRVMHTSLTTNNNLMLNDTSSAYSATATAAGGGIATANTSTTLTLKAGTGIGCGPTDYVNQNGITYVAYLWSEVAGFSKFGSYTGNGGSDGPFVYCGFRPRWVMVKNASGVGDWNLYDAARLAYNANDTVLFPNLSSAEQVNTGAPIDILSSGFKIRATAGNLNTSSSTYIFAAFAESPFKYSLAR